MEKRDHIAEEVEKTLRSFDTDPPLDANPFLLARVRAERERRLRKHHEGLVPRITLKYAVMLLVVVVHVVTLVHYFEWNSRHVLYEKLVSELKEDFHSDQSLNGF